MKLFYITLIISVLSFCIPYNSFGYDIHDDYPKRETRAVWLTTYSSLDWPKQKAGSENEIELQKKELTDILDNLKSININTVLLQTRIRGSLIYPSKLEPWDKCLTGIPGKSPGYDPLEFAVRECHRRGMEIHAWVVAIPGLVNKKKKLCVKHTDGKWYLNPGIPETAEYLGALCKEIAENYDIDGIHLDYIRYPENASRFNDAATYRKYGRGIGKAKWRRDNITRCVKSIHDAVKGIKPWVKMSCSPIGKYRDLSRYPSYNWNAYDAVHQDAQKWIKEGIQDILFPMMYFQGNHFYPFAIDWKENENGKCIVPGLGVYMLSPSEKNWSLDVITRELMFIRQIKLGGQAYFRYQFLKNNPKGIYDYLKDYYYAYPALTQTCCSNDSTAPGMPENVTLERHELYSIIKWNQSYDESSKVYYNIYASSEFPVDINKACNIMAVRLDSCQFAFNTLIQRIKGLNFAVTAMDRNGNESKPAQLLCTEIPERNERMLKLNGKNIILPEDCRKSEFITITDDKGRIITYMNFTYTPDISRLAPGLYHVRTLEKKGKSYIIGSFMK